LLNILKACFAFFRASSLLRLKRWSETTIFFAELTLCRYYYFAEIRSCYKFGGWQTLPDGRQAPATALSVSREL